MFFHVIYVIYIVMHYSIYCAARCVIWKSAPSRWIYLTLHWSVAAHTHRSHRYRSHSLAKEEWAKTLVTNTRGNITHVKNVAQKRWRDQVVHTMKREMTDTVDNIRVIKNSCLTGAHFVSRSWKGPILHQYFPWLTRGAYSWASGSPRTCWWELNGCLYNLLIMNNLRLLCRTEYC